MGDATQVVRFHRDSGNNKAVSLLRLRLKKVSSTKDLLSRQNCKGILCVSSWSPQKWRRRQDEGAERGIGASVDCFAELCKSELAECGAKNPDY